MTENDRYDAGSVSAVTGQDRGRDGDSAWFHCAECAEAAKDCQHDHGTSADGGVTWFCQGCGKPMEVPK